MQWRIQDFPGDGAPTLKVGGGANLLFCSILPKNCLQMKKIWGGGAIRSANGKSHSLMNLSYFGRGMIYKKVYEGYCISCIFSVGPQDNVWQWRELNIFRDRPYVVVCLVNTLW